MKEILAPAVRVKGFTDSWKQCKLGEMVNFSKGTGYSKSDLKESGTPIILYGRLYTKYETIISDVDTFVDEKPNSVFSEGGEVIVPASGETAEDISVASVVDQSGVLLGGDLNIVKPPLNLDSRFLAISISNGKPHHDMANMAQGKSVVHLHNSDLAKIDFPYPRYEEQCRISQYFKSIDHIISLHQRKLDQLKKLKKYFLQNMFPAKGEKVPRIRFKGFTGDWEQRKLGDIAKFINGRAYAQNELLPSGKYKVLRVGNFYTNNSWYYSDLELDDKYYANDGDLLYTWSATFGPHIWRGDRVIYHYHIWKIDLTDKLEKRFAVQLLEQDKNDILSGHNGSTMVHITKKGMEQKKVIIPKSIWEQRQLGLFFDNLDNLITLHQRKLNQLLTMKKFMLQNLFI